ncbi:MAG: hypothetical protein KIT58_17920 [Planctomycetota bacterium]|nr:hypothetical protein [Planctomycetota bacterium]
MPALRSLVVTFVALTALAAPAAAQAPDFTGTWTGASAEGVQAALKLEQRPGGQVTGSYRRGDAAEVPLEGAVRLDGVLQADLVAADGKRHRFEARLVDGAAVVTFVVPGQPPREVRLQRQAPAPVNPLGQPKNPLGGAPQNPLAAPPRPAWAGAWSDDQLKLVLEPAPAGFQGSLTTQGATYPVKGTAQGARLEGAFSVQGHDFAFTATQEGDALTLVSEGTTYRLRREQPRNPLGAPAPGPGTPPPPPQAGQGLDGVYDGPAQPVRHQGGFSFEMPQGWRVQEEQEGVILLAVDASPTPGAMVLIAHGEIEADERQKTPVQHITEFGPSLLENFGISQARPVAAPRAVTLTGPGAEGAWAGTLPNGVPAVVWTGAVFTPTRYVAVALIVQQGREQEFLPRAKRVLAAARIGG